jgi:hypothetical protein
MVKNKYYKTPPPPPPNKSQNINNTSQNSSFLGNIFQGIALGSGSSIGHKMVDGIFNEKNESKKQEGNEENNEKSYDSKILMNSFTECMKHNENISDCKIIYNIYLRSLQESKEE